MPPVGVKVSLNTEMQKFLQEKTVTPSPGQYPRMTADSAQVSAASVTWTNAEPDTLMEQVLVPANLRRAYQGGPLSPLLSNILLNELDRELERRGHRFVRYADDANIYVRSQRAGTRVMAGVERFLNQRLKLTLNREKSHVARPWVCDYLGYGMSWHQQPRLRVATMSLGRLHDRLRDLLRGARGHKMANVIERINPVLRGWAGYFKLSQSKRPLEEIDGWVRRKLRCVVWRQWKRPSTRARNLMRLGLSEARTCKSAFNGRGPWWSSGASHMNQALPKKLWDQLGLVSVLDTINRLSRIA
ncbi:maturase [Pseudomonas fluorescens NCIMB 11764]|jgi:RNA-directed DNA polymerase|uniref:Maturase n=1 Tax=Pseudomonas fluorescens NCIMB 11764 TaxID=1221522 RepID=A0A0K1QK40_PSEFL|nr:group II intron maturase-specific domain-containing protein [Pseudomonas fluorescens]AKV05805.1 maturase [Pseudomonas fluorescens NCIMB 11764]